MTPVDVNTDRSPLASEKSFALTGRSAPGKIAAVAGPSRREFVHRTVVGFGGYYVALVAGCRPRAPVAASPDAAAGLVTFAPAQFATLRAACERLLPRDEDPGALDLGVPEYIDRAMAEPELARWRDLLTKLLPVLDRQAKKRFGGKLFHEAAPDEQDLLLAAWQRGATGERHFFDALLSFTFEGAFGDPKHGGNRGGRGFAMIGFTPMAM